MFGKVTLAVLLIARITGAKPKQARRQGVLMASARRVAGWVQKVVDW